MRGPLFDLLFTRGAEVRAVVAFGPAIALLVPPAHHRGRTLFVLVDADGEEADDVFVDVRLALQLGDRRRRPVNIQRNVVRLAVLRDPIGERTQTPGLRLGDLPAIVFDDLGGVFRERIDLGLSEVLTREENMLVERHVSLVSLLADR